MALEQLSLPADIHPRVAAVLDDPSASWAMKTAVRALATREPIDAANDADVIATIFGDAAFDALKGALQRIATDENCVGNPDA